MEESRYERQAGGQGSVVTMVHVGHSLRAERRPATFPGEDRKRVERKYLRFAGVGIQFGLTVALLTFLGIWLDERFGTQPLFTIVLLLLGFVGATWSLIRAVLGPDKKE